MNKTKWNTPTLIPTEIFIKLIHLFEKSKLDLKAALTQYLSFSIDFFPVILFIYSSVGGE